METNDSNLCIVKCLWVFDNLQNPMIFSSCYLWDLLSHSLHLACQSQYMYLPILCPFLGIFFIKYPHDALPPPPSLWSLTQMSPSHWGAWPLYWKSYPPGILSPHLHNSYFFNFILLLTTIHNHIQFLSLSLSFSKGSVISHLSLVLYIEHYLVS